MTLGLLNNLSTTESLIYTSLNSSSIVEEVSGSFTSVLGFQAAELLNTKYECDHDIGDSYTRPHKNGKAVKVKLMSKFPLENGGKLVIEKLNVIAVPLVPLPQFNNEQAVMNMTSNQPNYDILYYLDSEIRNPLTGIDSTSELLTDTLQGFIQRNDFSGCTCGKALTSQFYSAIEQAAEDVEYIMYCAKYIRSILSNQIDLPRLKSGGIHLQPSQIYLLKDIINPIMKMLYSQKAENVRVDIECDEMLRIKTDSYRLTQVLESILGMAFRSTSSGTVCIKCTLIENDVPLRQDISQSLKSETAEKGTFSENSSSKSLQITIEATSENLQDLELSMTHPSDHNHAPPLSAHTPHSPTHHPTISADRRKRSNSEIHSNNTSSKSAYSHIDALSATSARNTTNTVSWLELPRLLVSVMEGKLSVGSSSTAALEVVITIPSELEVITMNYNNLYKSVQRKESAKLIPEIALNSPRALTLSDGGNISPRPKSTDSVTTAAILSGFDELRNKTIKALDEKNNAINLAELQKYRLSIRHLRVLLVNENPIIIKLHTRLLQSCLRGASNTTLTNQVIIAYTGEEAIELCEKDGRFDVIVIGENMTSSGGILLGHEVVSKIRKTFKMNATVIIGYSGNDTECESHFMEAGADLIWGKQIPAAETVLSDISNIRIKRLGLMASQLPGTKKLLLVDDSAVTVKHFIRRLKLTLPASWAIKSKDDLDKVMDKLLKKTNYYDVIITGEYFGGSDKIVGSNFISKLRENGYEGVLIGCSADPRFVEKHLRCGADLAWTKPPPSNEIIVSQLLNLLHKFMVPEPTYMNSRKINRKLNGITEAVVTAVTAYNKAFDSKTKPTLNRKVPARLAARRNQIKANSESAKSTDTTTSTDGSNSNGNIHTTDVTSTDEGTGSSKGKLSNTIEEEKSFSLHVHNYTLSNSSSVEKFAKKQIQFTLDAPLIILYRQNTPAIDILKPFDENAVMDDGEGSEEGGESKAMKLSSKGKEMFIVGRKSGNTGGRRKVVKDIDDSDDDEDE